MVLRAPLSRPVASPRNRGASRLRVASWCHIPDPCHARARTIFTGTRGNFHPISLDNDPTCNVTRAKNCEDKVYKTATRTVNLNHPSARTGFSLKIPGHPCPAALAWTYRADRQNSYPREVSGNGVASRCRIPESRHSAPRYRVPGSCPSASAVPLRSEHAHSR